MEAPLSLLAPLSPPRAPAQVMLRPVAEALNAAVGPDTEVDIAHPPTRPSTPPPTPQPVR
jgi:hypothetical protein